jgi:microcin C transport system permease protein
MSPRRTGFLLLIYAVLAALFQWLGYKVPVFKIPFLGGGWGIKVAGFTVLSGTGLGWALLLLIACLGIRWLLRNERTWQFSPLTLKQIKRFRSLKRGYVSFLVLLALSGVAALDNLVVGKRALVVKYAGQYFFPFLRADVLTGKTFGQQSDAETDYRELAHKFQTQKQGNWVWMPLIPFDPTLDSDEVIQELTLSADGRALVDGKLFNGRAYTSFQGQPESKRQEFTFRDGLKQGEMRGWDASGEQVERGLFEKGEQREYTDYSQGKVLSLKDQAGVELRSVVYPPAPPSLTHWLGTDAAGQDVLAILFGGLQQAIIAAVLFLVFVFTVGIITGGTMGYFGGWADLLGQRLVEIWSVLPFLFIVMIISTFIQPNLFILVCIIALFSWMGTSYLLRTATMREKARDYSAAAKLLGASPWRVLFRHILPNTIAILVTLAPFEVAGVITSLAALDFLGFGLPPEVPSWGRLLHEGTESFNYPWIVSAAFVAMVGTLILVTFVGEAVREAFDPKKFTVYR